MVEYLTIDNIIQKYYTEHFYMVSDNIEELQQEYKKKKQDWINSRREYLVSQIKLLDEMEKECF